MTMSQHSVALQHGCNKVQRREREEKEQRRGRAEKEAHRQKQESNTCKRRTIVEIPTFRSLAAAGVSVKNIDFKTVSLQINPDKTQINLRFFIK